MGHDYQSPWFKEALEIEDKLVINQLNSRETADICIVGGGYTGLWTALKIKEKNPSTNIIVIEKDNYCRLPFSLSYKYCDSKSRKI